MFFATMTNMARIDSKYSNTRYSHNTRAFQTMYLCSRYHLKHEVMPNDSGGVAVQEIDAKQIMMLNTNPNGSAWCLTVSEYVKSIRPFVPKHLLRRFRKIIDAFNKADLGSPSSSELVGLAHGMFQHSQDAVDMVLVLFRRARVLDVCPCERVPDLDVEASLVYRMQ